jgi:hypothetical protein
LLRDLCLRDLVDLLADRAPPRQHSPAHEHETEEDRHRGSEQEVGDGLRDREIERAEVNRHPRVLLELL